MVLWAVPGGTPGVPVPLCRDSQGSRASQAAPRSRNLVLQALRGVLAAPSLSPSKGEAAEGAALTGDGPSSWHLPDLGPIIPWQ